MAQTTLTFGIMDAPYESARTTTALRLIDIAVKRGYDVNVFAYEGAVMLPFKEQQPHANAVHGRNVEEENHLLTREVVAALLAEAGRHWRPASASSAATTSRVSRWFSSSTLRPCTALACGCCSLNGSMTAPS